jgi:hypothetical protein
VPDAAGAYLAYSQLSRISVRFLIFASSTPFSFKVLTALFLVSSDTGILSLSLR